MKNYFKLFLMAVVAVAAFPSCSDDNKGSDEIYGQTLDGCFEFVTDITNGGSAGYNQLGYKIEYNMTKMTATVGISNVRLPGGTSYPTMTLADMPMEIKKDGWIVISAPKVEPSIAGFGAVPEISNFSLSVLNRDFGGVNYPGFAMRMNIDMKYSILSAPEGVLLLGKTTTTAVGGEAVESTATSYILQVNPETRMLTITMSGASFVPGMPAMDIVLDGVPFVVNGSKMNFNAAAVTPKIGGTPFPAFPITNLSGSCDFAQGMDMNFHCNPMTMPTEYDVAVSTDFTFVDNSNM